MHKYDGMELLTNRGCTSLLRIRGQVITASKTKRYCAADSRTYLYLVPAYERFMLGISHREEIASRLCAGMFLQRTTALGPMLAVFNLSELKP